MFLQKGLPFRLIGNGIRLTERLGKFLIAIQQPVKFFKHILLVSFLDWKLLFSKKKGATARWNRR